MQLYYSAFGALIIKIILFAFDSSIAFYLMHLF
jgi:hypothetical protein